VRYEDAVAVPYLNNGEFLIRVLYVDSKVTREEDVKKVEIELNKHLNIDNSTYPN